MNQALAALYGITKEASAEPEATSTDDDIDLSQISAEDFLQALAEAEGEEKTAADQLLGQLTGQSTEEALLSKMASTGQLDELEMMGRVIARAQADELRKIAAEEEGLSGDDELPDEIEVDLSQLSAQDLMELNEAGYSFEDPSEKTAGARTDAAVAAADRALRGLGAKGRSARKSVIDRLRGGAAEGPSVSPDMARRANRRAGAKMVAGAGAAGGAATGAAGYAAMKRRKKDSDY